MSELTSLTGATHCLSGSPRLWFLIPGDLDTPTGGYRYDRRIIAGLRTLGWSVEHHALDPSFPDPTPAALAKARAVLASIPDTSLVLVDGLAFGVLPDLVEAEGARLRFLALVHHPLALETGLAPERAAVLRTSETRALAQARLVLVTSRFTAGLLADYAVPAGRIRVIEPGTDPVPHWDREFEGRRGGTLVSEAASTSSTPPDVSGTRLAHATARAVSLTKPAEAIPTSLSEAMQVAVSEPRSTEVWAPALFGISSTGATAPDSADSPLRLLCVASLTPRKGHDLLLNALAGLKDLSWHLECVGSPDHDPGWAEGLRALREALGLSQRVSFRGPLSGLALSTCYATADLFVLPSHFEGYGMVFAEALAHGLPILATRAGAIGDTVPEAAGLLVPPGDTEALNRVLRRLLEDGALRDRLAAGAREAGLRLPTWEQAAAAFAAALAEVRSVPVPFPNGRP